MSTKKALGIYLRDVSITALIPILHLFGRRQYLASAYLVRILISLIYTLFLRPCRSFGGFIWYVAFGIIILRHLRHKFVIFIWFLIDFRRFIGSGQLVIVVSSWLSFLFKLSRFIVSNTWFLSLQSLSFWLYHRGWSALFIRWRRRTFWVSESYLNELRHFPLTQITVVILIKLVEKRFKVRSIIVFSSIGLNNLCYFIQEWQWFFFVQIPVSIDIMLCPNLIQAFFKIAIIILQQLRETLDFEFKRVPFLNA
jgi:hypothetical protein